MNSDLAMQRWQRGHCKSHWGRRCYHVRGHLGNNAVKITRLTKSIMIHQQWPGTAGTVIPIPLCSSYRTTVNQNTSQRHWQSPTGINPLSSSTEQTNVAPFFPIKVHHLLPHVLHEPATGHSLSWVLLLRGASLLHIVRVGTDCHGTQQSLVQNIPQMSRAKWSIQVQNS